MSSDAISAKLGDMGKIDDMGYDARYPKEGEIMIGLSWYYHNSKHKV